MALTKKALRNLRTLVTTDITETSKQKVLSERFKTMNYAWYSWHFTTQVPPSERLDEAECRVAWHRDMLDPAIEKCTRKILNRKSGLYEEQQCMLIDTEQVATKDQIAAEKRQSSRISSKANATEQSMERSKQSVLNFLTMSGDDAFFSAT